MSLQYVLRPEPFDRILKYWAEGLTWPGAMGLKEASSHPLVFTSFHWRYNIPLKILPCRGLTRAIYILSIEHLRMTCLSQESNPGPPMKRAIRTAVFSCHSGSQLCCYSSPPSHDDGGSWLNPVARDVRMEIRPNACCCVRIAHHVGVTTM